MANNIIRRTWKQGGMVNIEDLRGSAFQEEDGGHTFLISGVDENGDALALSGTPAGVLLRADGQDVTLTCSVSDGVVSATLPANAYVVPGRIGITIFLTNGGQKTAIYAAIAAVATTSSGTVAPPAGSDVVDLVNAIATAVATIPANYTDLMAAIAPTYSTSALYAVGSYAWYSGKLYRCTTAITSGETWTSAHWTQANLGSDVSDLKSALRLLSDALEEYYIKSFSKNLYDYSLATVGRLNGATGEVLVNSGYFVSDFIPVESDTLYSFCYFNSSQQSTNASAYCACYDADKNVIAGSDTTMHYITTGSACAYIRVSETANHKNTFMVAKGSKPANNSFENFDNFYDYIIETIGIANIKQWLEDNKDYLIDAVNDLFLKSLTNNLYNSAASLSGYRVKGNDGSIVPNASYFVSDYIPVSGSTKYSFCYFNSLDRTNAYNCYVGQYDSNHNAIAGNDTTVNNITTNASCRYIRVAGETARQNVLFVVKGEQPANGSWVDFRSGGDIFNNKLNVLNGTRRCVISFIFDDGLANDYLIKNIFTSAEKTCGFALKSSVTSGQVTTYLGYQTNGFEILSHSTGDATPTTEQPLRESENVLSGYGFKVRGWVTPASALGAKYRKWLRKYYDFGYTIVYGGHSDTTIDPSNQPSESEYNLQRVSLESTQTYELLQNAVDNAIASGGFLTFYAHSQYIDVEGHGAFTTENLENLIDYIKSKEADGYCKLMNPSDCYDAYYKMRHDDLWLMLN